MQGAARISAKTKRERHGDGTWWLGVTAGKSGLAWCQELGLQQPFGSSAWRHSLPIVFIHQRASTHRDFSAHAPLTRIDDKHAGQLRRVASVVGSSISAWVNGTPIFVRISVASVSRLPAGTMAPVTELLRVLA